MALQSTVSSTNGTKIARRSELNLDFGISVGRQLMGFDGPFNWCKNFSLKGS